MPKKKKGWRKKNVKRLHEEKTKVNVPIVDNSLQNEFKSSDDALSEIQQQIENLNNKENTVTSVNVPIVDNSLQNEFKSSDYALSEIQSGPVVVTSLQNKESSDEPVRMNLLDDTDSKTYHTLELATITREQESSLLVDEDKDTDMTYSHKENNALNLPFDEIQKLQSLVAITRTQDNPNISAHQSPAHSDEEDIYIIKPEEKVEEIRICGNRVIDFMYLLEQLQEISHHNSPFGCNFNNLKLVGEKRKGYVSKFEFVCKMCNAKLSLKNCKKSNNNKELDLNENVVSAFMSIGSGYAGLEQVSASLEIPSMSDQLYAKCHARVCELWETAKEKCMEEAANFRGCLHYS